MQKDLVIIKKKYGENFAKLCRELFPTLLENEGKLAEIILNKFAPSRSLYSDIINNNLKSEFKNYVYSQTSITAQDEVSSNLSPQELMDKAGYVLYKCETDADVKEFKKYYAKNEALCTFHDPNRINRNLIFFAVKKNIDEIKRENFKKPERQDEYGTSVISLQFSKGNPNYLSIKNRYNHSVSNPDATFSNNLENIYPGLKSSFEKFYNLNLIKIMKNFEIPNYVIAPDGKFYKYNYEINNIYYCENNIIIDNFEVKQYDKGRYEVFDYFILDKTTKIISTNAPDDSFINEFENANKIDIEKDKQTGNRIFKVLNKDGTAFNFAVNKSGQIVSYENFNTEIIPPKFLYNNIYLENIEIPNVKKISKSFLRDNQCLEELVVLNLEHIESDCLMRAKKLKTFIAPRLEKMGDYCFHDAFSLVNLNITNINKMGFSCFYDSENLTCLDVPFLEIMGSYCFQNGKSINKLTFTKLKEMGNRCFSQNISLTEFNAPQLEKMDYCCFYFNEKIENIYVPNLTHMGDSCFKNNKELKQFSALNLKTIGADCLMYNKILSYFNAPKLEEMGINCLMSNLNLEKLYLPSLKIMKEGCLYKNNSLTEFYAPNLERMHFKCLRNNLSLQAIYAPNLITVNNMCFEKNNLVQEQIKETLRINRFKNKIEKRLNKNEHEK